MSFVVLSKIIWRPPSLSGLTTIIFNMELTHLDSDLSICLTAIFLEFNTCLYFYLIPLQGILEYLHKDGGLQA